MSAENMKLKQDLQNMTRQNDLKKKEIDELKSQLSMSGDSIHIIKDL
jgi:hypothetical protein